MPVLFTFSAGAFAVAHFVAEHAAGHIVGGEAHHFYRHFLERWSESPIDPKTGLPHNHDLENAGAEALRSALFVLVMELAGRIEPKKTWLNNWAAKIPGGGILTKEIFPGAQDPQRRWLDGLRKIVSGDGVKSLHRTLKLEESSLRQCFAEADVCQALGSASADSILEWAHLELAGWTEHADFESLVRVGWEVPGTPNRVTLAHAYCLFFREHLKSNPKVFHILIADTLNDVRNHLMALGMNVTTELKSLRNELETLAPNNFASLSLDFTQFQQWMEPQLGEINGLLSQAITKLDALTNGQGEILIALVTFNAELRRGNETARGGLIDMISRLEHGHAEQMTAHEKTQNDLATTRAEVGEVDSKVAQNLSISANTQINIEIIQDRLSKIEGKLGDCAPKSQNHAEGILVLTGTFSLEQLPVIEAVIQQIIERMKDPKVTLKRIESGSIKVTLSGEPESLQQLQALIKSGELDQALAGRIRGWSGRVFIRGLSRATDRFVGREQEIALLNRVLIDETTRIVVITGPGGIGKTCLLTHWLGLLVQQNFPAPQRVFAWGFYEQPSMPTFVDALLDWDGDSSMQGAPLRQKSIHLARRIANGPARTLICLDGLEVLLGRSANPTEAEDGDALIAFLSALATESNEGSLCVITSRSLPPLPIPPQKLMTMTVGPLSDSASKELLFGGIQGDFRNWQEPFVQLACGHPLALTILRNRLSLPTGETGNASIERIAAGLDDAAVCLNTLGRRAEATTTAQQAVEIYRALVSQRPDAFRPALAGSLNNLAILLSEVGQRAEALAPAQEAVELHRALARENPEAFQSNLALSLNNLANRLAELGWREEALAPAQEAVELYRLLAHKNPKDSLLDLATSLNNLANRLGELGQREQALAPAQEAVELHRALARENPDAFQSNLALSLNNLANRLSELGRREEALAPAREAVHLLYALARQNPDAFQPNLAMSLNNLANRLGELGRPAEALTLSQEAVNLNRSLAHQNPDAFQPHLAMSLNNLATQLSQLGRPAEALGLAQEAVTLHRSLVHQNPDAFLLDLAVSLGALSLVLLGTGQFTEAESHLAEAIRILQPRFSALPEAFTALQDSLARAYLRATRGERAQPGPELLKASQDRVGVVALLSPDLRKSIDNITKFESRSTSQQIELFLEEAVEAQEKFDQPVASLLPIGTERKLVRISPETHKKLAEWSRRTNRTLQKQIIHILHKALELRSGSDE
jgi:HEPN domain-containing protein